MIVAIDETGSFSPASSARSFFVAVHIRQRKTLYKQKQSQFIEWENSLPKKLKNAKGEIKSSLLTADQLTQFAREVVLSHYHIGITPCCIRPSRNPAAVVEKYLAVNLAGIREGARESSQLGRPRMAQLYEEFGNWLTNLSYVQYVKIFLLGSCMSTALVNTVGHAISGGYDDELTRIKFLIDRDFIKEPRPNIFWHELLRNQLYHHSLNDPLPLLNTWQKTGHPFMEKYRRDGHVDLKELFWKQCSFVSSQDYYEIRIADAISTIISRFINKHDCREAYAAVRKCFLRQGRIVEYLLQDFDLTRWRYEPEKNPWLNMPTTD